MNVTKRAGASFASGSSSSTHNKNNSNNDMGALTRDDTRDIISDLMSWLRLWRVKHVDNVLKETFLPAGYPESVSGKYSAYVGWQAVHHCSSAANGALASAFLLYSAGMGSTEALPTAGAINWLLKDGIGQLGTLVFARFMAKDFDSHARLWYVGAAVALNAAIATEIMTFLWPEYFLLMAAAANGVKGISWMAGGATRTAFHVSFAKTGNIADVTAKATSQTICMSLIGTWIGLVIAASVHQRVGVAAVSCGLLSCAHIFSAYMSARQVPLKSLNASRSSLIASCIFSGDPIPTPEEASSLDPLGCTPFDLKQPIYSAPLHHVAKQKSFAQALRMFYQSKYIYVPVSMNRRPYMILHRAAGYIDIIESAYFAHRVAEDKDLLASLMVDPAGRQDQATQRRVEVLLQASRDAVKPCIGKISQRGWDTRADRQAMNVLVAYW